MMAPMITLMARRTCIMPELTNPTTMTLVAAEDWITAVTPVPRSSPRSGVPVSLYRMTSSLFPATFFRPSPMSPIPKRNMATPPRRTSAFPIINSPYSNESRVSFRSSV